MRISNKRYGTPYLGVALAAAALAAGCFGSGVGAQDTLSGAGLTSGEESLQDIGQLQELVARPLSKEVSLNSLLTNPQDNMDPELLLLGDPLQRLLDNGDLTQDQWAEYSEKLGAMHQLARATAKFPMAWILLRKDRADPTVFEALLAADSHDILSDDEIDLARPEHHGNWLKLLDARNPMCRMIAVRAADEWARDDELLAVLSRGLRDEYCGTRRMALEHFGELRPDGMQAVLRDFVGRKLPSGLP